MATANKVSVWDENADRDADEVLLARLREFEDPDAYMPIQSVVTMVVGVVRAKVAFVVHEYRKGNGVEDDELLDAGFWLQEIVDMDVTPWEVFLALKETIEAEGIPMMPQEDRRFKKC